MVKKWKRVVDNKMKWQGDIDDEKMIIRLNKLKSKNKSSIIDTIIHEELHRKHPKMHEKTVYKKTKELLKRVGSKEKKKLYSKYQ